MAEKTKTKKIIVMNEIGEARHDYPNKGFKKRFEELGHTVIQYIGSERENFLLSNRHFQVYEDILSFAEKVDADILFMSTVICPEHLLAELKVRKEYKPEIFFLSTFREPARSLARATVFKDLIDNEFIKKALFVSNLGARAVLPSYWKEAGIDEEKTLLIGEPIISEIYDDEPTPLIEDLDLPKDKKIGLFFGRDDPSKGLDDLCKTLDLINEDIHILIVTHGSDYTEDRAFNMERENTSVVYRNIKDSEIVGVFSKVDFVILPYKKSYKFGGSGILNIAVDFNKPIIVPNLYPFSNIIDWYQLGLTFESEDYMDLAKTIDLIAEFHDNIKKGANFTGYKNILSTYDEVADLMVES